MQAVILGDGAMGRAVATMLAERGHEVLGVLGKPAGRHPGSAFRGADVVFDFTAGGAVASNVRDALDGGCSRIVIGTTAWDGSRADVERLLRERGASAVAASSFSPGAALLAWLAEEVTSQLGSMPDYDPFVMEWHRRTKADRPSGTARELSRRILAASPRKRRVSDGTRAGPPDPDELDVTSVRAGASPGMHVVGFDAPGETLEVRLTARDRTPYASGAIAAAEWLVAAARHPGIHSFESVLMERPLAAGATGPEPRPGTTPRPSPTTAPAGAAPVPASAAVQPEGAVR